jgi:hypothetical protein
LLIGVIGCGGLVGLAIVLILALAVIGTPSSQQGGQKETSTKSTSTNGTEYAIGEPVELRDRTLTVNEVERNYSYPDGGWKPGMGNENVRVNVTLENTSKSAFDVNPLNFKLEESKGVRRSEKLINTPPNRISSGSVAPYGTLTGNVVFEAPQDDNPLKLVYEPPGLRGQTVSVNL